MKKLYFFVGITFGCLAAHSQPPLETIGNPATSMPVATYTGWSNQGVVTYTGNAEVQNTNPSNSLHASGGGNVFFTNTPGVYFQLSGLPPAQYHDGIGIEFELFGYDTAHLNELNLTVSTDSGVTWSNLPYRRFWGPFFAPTPWDHFSATFSDMASSINITRLMVRFTQTTTTKTFKIDDIRLTYYVLLPVKLIDFTATVYNRQTVLKWNASTSSNKELFVVEKSRDGMQFSSVAQQYAKGVGEYAYTFNDEVNHHDKTFYRLKMISTDGKISYSKVVIVSSESIHPALIQAVYPLPSRDVLHVLLNNDAGKKISLSILDCKGSLRMQKRILLSTGIADYPLPIQYLEAGTYYLIIDNSQTKETQKIVIAK